MTTNRYTIYIADREVATIEGAEIAYACYDTAKAIAEMTGEVATLVRLEDGKVLANSDEDDE